MIPVLGFCTLKRFDLADRLLASIDYPVEHLVIVDNSGTQSWNPVVPQFVKNVWLIRVPYGLGLVGAWNLIIKSTPYAPYWLLINDDAWFEPGASLGGFNLFDLATSCGIPKDNLIFPNQVDVGTDLNRLSGSVS